MQQHVPSTSPLSRLIPTRRAAIALLALDAVLLALPLFIRWQNWFAFAYVPLLITVVLGALMSGSARLATLLSGIVIPIFMGSLWIVLKLYPPNMAVLGTVLRAGMIGLTCLGAVWFCIAAWGWVKFFAGRPVAT